MSTDSDIGGMDEGSALVAEYALGLLTAAEHTTVAQRLRAEPALRSELRIWQRRLPGLDRQFAEQAAPAAVWNRLEARLFGGAPARGGFWNSLALWRSIAAGGVAVAIAAIGFNLAQPARLSPEEYGKQLVAAIQAQPGSNVEFVALYDTATASVRLISLSGEVAADKDLELWYIQGTDKPVSMGVIKVNQKTEIDLDEAARSKIGEGTVLAITLEEKGGSRTGNPSDTLVAAGPALSI